MKKKWSMVASIERKFCLLLSEGTSVKLNVLFRMMWFDIYVETFVPYEYYENQGIEK